MPEVIQNEHLKTSTKETIDKTQETNTDLEKTKKKKKIRTKNTVRQANNLLENTPRAR